MNAEEVLRALGGLGVETLNNLDLAGRMPPVTSAPATPANFYGVYGKPGVLTEQFRGELPPATFNLSNTFASATTPPSILPEIRPASPVVTANEFKLS